MLRLELPVHYTRSHYLNKCTPRGLMLYHFGQKLILNLSQISRTSFVHNLLLSFQIVETFCTKLASITTVFCTHLQNEISQLFCSKCVPFGYLYYNSSLNATTSTCLMKTERSLIDAIIIRRRPWGWFSIKLLSYRYKKSHCEVKRSYDRLIYTRDSLYW